MIEFIDGEDYCRWNGTLMSPENCVKLFGAEGEIDVEEDCIIDGATIYTDGPIGEILYQFGEVHDKPKPYDAVLSQGYGFKDHCWEESLAGRIVFDADFIKDLEVKPMKAFKKDYPKFNEELHNAFYDELEEYYENMGNQ